MLLLLVMRPYFAVSLFSYQRMKRSSVIRSGFSIHSTVKRRITRLFSAFLDICTELLRFFGARAHALCLTSNTRTRVCEALQSHDRACMHRSVADLPRREVTVTGKKRLFAIVLLAIPSWAAAAQSHPGAGAYPTRPLRFVVPYPPGGTTDIVARGIGGKLTERFQQQVVIDNRGGASTIIGAEAVAKAAPDGYTLLLGTATTFSINPQVYAKLPYDAVRDFAPISSATYVPFVIAAHPSVPANSITELVALAKAKPGLIRYSTPGNASTNHVAGALLESMANIKLLHVPYKGSGPAATAALAGEVQLVITGIGTLASHWKAGKLKVLAIGADKRHPNWPDIPSTGEAGLKGYEAGTWFGVFTRAGTPRAIVDKLNAEIVAALATPDLKERLTAIGFDVLSSTPEEFASFMKNDMARAAKVIKAAGIKLTE
jgi:tripartite-type tricarboxylate transporter receptor subunit TctC